MEANTLYTTLITGASDNKTYKDIINKKINLMNMDIKIIFKFYESLHILYSPYYQVWFTLPTDYNYFKNYCAKNCSECSNIPQISEIKSGHSSIQDNAELSAQGSEATSSSSSITSRLIPVLSAFIAIPIFLGIAYKVNNNEFKI
ncbi:PIR protein CIR protein, fragment [Plasmodium vinckei petteri]|uniref:PIR protein CIR protein n=1 Tax=Plasmodium vinckei petteri TaxID=138298 RepID=A0A6V7SI33_PLAVN|nr:PIR protein CIR protein, fragment [Plasmodium vinckei petteri]